MFGISAFAEAPFASLAGVTVVVAITGVQASGAVGTVIYVLVVSVAITGVEASGAVGTVVYSPFVTAALTGVEAVGVVGDVIETNNPTDDGVVATGSVGTIPLITITVLISGVSASGQVGTADYFYWTTIDDSETPNWQNVAMTV